MSISYDPKRDGSLSEYILRCRDERIPPLFQGQKAFHQLWQEGYFDPEVSLIRIMWNHARSDEQYLIVGSEEVEGIETPAHAGQPGRHTIDAILTKDCPAWEAHSLNPKPQPRKKE